MRPSRLIIVGPAAALLLLASNAHAGETMRVYTCIQDNANKWQMSQPVEHYELGKMPTWADCLAWRNGDPGPAYEWSYGLTAATTTTTTAETVPPATTTTAPPDTTIPPTTSQAYTTTTYEPPTTAPQEPAYEANTTTTALPLATYPTTTQPPETTLVTVLETTTTVTETVPPTTPPVTTVQPSPAIEAQAQGFTNDLAPGVSPTAARVVVLSTIGSFMLSPSPTTRRKSDSGKTGRRS